MSFLPFQAWDDFDTYTIGTNVTGYTLRGGGAPTYKPQYSTTSILPYKRRYLEFLTDATTDYHAVSRDAVDSDANRATFNIVFGFAMSLCTVEELHVYARGAGTSPMTDFLRASIVLASGTIRIDKMVASVYTAGSGASSGGVTLTAGHAYLARFSGSAGNISLMIWDAALGMAGESAARGITPTGMTPTAAGWVGWGGKHTTLTGKVAAFNFDATATNGDAAVCPRTNGDRTAWLAKQDVMRLVVAKMRATGYDSSGSPYTKTINAYIANHGYTSAAQDTPSLQHFDACITGVPEISREMPAALNGQAALKIGTLTVANPASSTSGAGRRDDWLRVHWKRDGFELLMGGIDPVTGRAWPLHDFFHVLRGRLGNPVAPDLGSIEFQIADMSEALNAPVQTQFSSGNYNGAYKPAIIGQAGGAAYMEPPLTTTSSYTYTISDGAITGSNGQTDDWAFDVRDNGIPISTLNIFALTWPTISAVDTGTETITSVGHGALVDASVIFQAGTAPPAPLVQGTVYFIIAAGFTADTFRVSATRGGAAINLTSATTGGGFVAYNYVVDAAAATVRLLAHPAGRVTVGSAEASDTATWTFAGMYANVVFTRLGLSLNYKDAATFTTLAATCVSNLYYGWQWLDTTLHTGKDVCAAIAAGSFTWYGFAPDGLMQVGMVGLPAASGVLTLDRSDIDGISLPDTVRAINFAAGTFGYCPAFVGGTPIPSTLYPFPLKKKVLSAYSYGAAGIPLDDHPDRWDADQSRSFDTIATYDSTGASNLRAAMVTLYKSTLGIYPVATRKLTPLEVNLGDTISVDFPRLGFKNWTGADDPSPDNTADFDGRLAVVVGHYLKRNKAGNSYSRVDLRVLRRIPGYYPTANLN